MPFIHYYQIHLQGEYSLLHASITFISRENPIIFPPYIIVTFTWIVKQPSFLQTLLSYFIRVIWLINLVFFIRQYVHYYSHPTNDTMKTQPSLCQPSLSHSHDWQYCLVSSNHHCFIHLIGEATLFHSSIIIKFIWMAYITFFYSSSLIKFIWMANRTFFHTSIITRFIWRVSKAFFHLSSLLSFIQPYQIHLTGAYNLIMPLLQLSEWQYSTHPAFDNAGWGVNPALHIHYSNAITFIWTMNVIAFIHYSNAITFIWMMNAAFFYQSTFIIFTCNPACTHPSLSYSCNWQMHPLSIHYISPLNGELCF